MIAKFKVGDLVKISPNEYNKLGPFYNCYVEFYARILKINSIDIFTLHWINYEKIKNPQFVNDYTWYSPIFEKVKLDKDIKCRKSSG